MNGTGLGKDKMLYLKVLGLYPELGNSFPATASGKLILVIRWLFDMMAMNWMQHKNFHPFHYKH